MNNQQINKILTYSLDLLLAMVLILIMLLFQKYLTGINIMIIGIILTISILPIHNYLHDQINSIISPVVYDELYVQTAESILNFEQFDEVLKTTFDKIMHLTNVASGFLVFYYNESSEFKIFYQKNKRRKTIRKARIDSSNIILKVINCSDDIIVKSKLDNSIHFEKSIIEEMDKLGCEVVIPIYYHDIFLGLIFLGERKRKFPDREMRLLKIFASRIAILSVNSYFFNELLKKKEIEKEYEIASKTQRKFLPKTEMLCNRIQIKVFHNTTSLMTREFYDIFVNEKYHDDIRISAYQLQGNITGTSIYMPAIQSLLHSYSRLGFKTSRVISKLKGAIKERDLMDEDITIIHLSLSQSGKLTYCNSYYQSPLIYRNKDQKLRSVREKRKGANTHIQLETGDVLILACESYYKKLTGQITESGALIKKNKSSLKKMHQTLLTKIIKDDEDEQNDQLLITLLLGEKE